MKNGQNLTLIKDLSYRTSNESGTLPQGSTIAVVQVDKINKKVLVDLGQKTYQWYGIETLSSLTQHAP